MNEKPIVPDLFSPQTPNIVELKSADNSKRIEHIWTDRFIEYPAAKKIIARLETLLDRPNSHRPKCMLLTAHTNNGKTHLLKEFCADYPPDPNPEGDAMRIPVLYFQAPADGKSRGLFLNILHEVRGSFNPLSSTATLQASALNLLRHCDVKMLIIDEIHNLLVRGNKTPARREILNLFRFLANDLQIPLVFAGIEEAAVVPLSDEQLANRFEHHRLPIWNNDAQLRALLRIMESNLPLRRGSDLTSASAIEVIRQRTELLFGEILELVRVAAEEAVGTSERVTTESLKTNLYRGPRERQQPITSV